MPDSTDIYVTNFTESLKQLQRYLVFGFSSALFYMLLSESRSMIDAEGKGVNLPGLVPTSTLVAGLFALVVSFASGALANTAYDDATRILPQLQEKPEILLAALTYPSVATSGNFVPRLGLTLTPIVLYFFNAKEWLGALPMRHFVICSVLYCTPYIMLVFRLRKPLGFWEIKAAAERLSRDQWRHPSS